MLRQIITPLEPSFTLQFPTDMVGKTVEIIAFELKETNRAYPASNADKLKQIARIQDITRKSLVDLSIPCHVLSDCRT